MFPNLGLMAGLLIAVGCLFLVNGLSVGAILIFVVAPLLAYLISRAQPPLAWLAASFLCLIDAGVLLASLDLLPDLFNNFPKLPRADNRLLSFHLAVYTFYVGAVLPPYAFGRSLWKHRRGEPADLAPFICWLGIATWTLILTIALSAFIGCLQGGFKR